MDHRVMLLWWTSASSRLPKMIKAEERMSWRALFWQKSGDTSLFAPTLAISSENNLTVQSIESIIDRRCALQEFNKLAWFLARKGWIGEDRRDMHHFTNPENFAYTGWCIIMVDYGCESILKHIDNQDFTTTLKEELDKIMQKFLKKGKIKTRVTKS